MIGLLRGLGLDYIWLWSPRTKACLLVFKKKRKLVCRAHGWGVVVTAISIISRKTCMMMRDNSRLYAEAIYRYENKERCAEWHLQRSNSSIAKGERNRMNLNFFQLFCKFHRKKKVCVFPRGKNRGKSEEQHRILCRLASACTCGECIDSGYTAWLSTDHLVRSSKLIPTSSQHCLWLVVGERKRCQD